MVARAMSTAAVALAVCMLSMNGYAADSLYLPAGSELGLSAKTNIEALPGQAQTRASFLVTTPKLRDCELNVVLESRSGRTYVQGKSTLFCPGPGVAATLSGQLKSSANVMGLLAGDNASFLVTQGVKLPAAVASTR